MSIVLIVAAIFAGLLLFSFIQKLIKWIFIFTTLLILTLIGGYLFLSGDGSMTEPYLPDEVQNEVNSLRDNTNAKIQSKTQEAKDAASQKAAEITEKAVQRMEEGIQTAVDESKKSIEKGVHEAWSGKSTEATTEESKDNASTENIPTENTPTEQNAE